jgi:hypothetical protein
VPDSAQGTVTFNSFSGRLSSEMPLTMQSSSRRALKAELAAATGSSLRFQTFSGERQDRPVTGLRCGSGQGPSTSLGTGPSAPLGTGQATDTIGGCTFSLS